MKQIRAIIPVVLMLVFLLLSCGKAPTVDSKIPSQDSGTVETTDTLSPASPTVGLQQTETSPETTPVTEASKSPAEETETTPPLTEPTEDTAAATEPAAPTEATATTEPTTETEAPEEDEDELPMVPAG